MTSQYPSDEETNVDGVSTRRYAARIQYGSVVNERILQLQRTRSGYKAVLSRKRRELLDLMNDDENIDLIRTKQKEVDESFDNFALAHTNVHSQLHEQGEIKQSECYYREQYDQAIQLKKAVESWINDVKTKNRIQHEIQPEDSVSQASSSKNPGFRKTSTVSTSSSTRLRLVEEAANRRALEAKLQLLHDKQTLVEESMRLQQERERLTLPSEIAQCVAREQVFAKAEAAENANEDMKTNINVPSSRATSSKPDRPNYLLKLDNSKKLYDTKQRWIESPQIQPKSALTLNDLFIQQQMNSMALSLLKPEVPIFNGDAMEYSNFIRAFESIIEANTKSSSAKLYYLVQYTSGEVRELMRSCLAMDSDKGYVEAKQLLKKRFGQNYRIATAYVEKITKGPPIKREDGPALQRFSVQLTSCINTLKEIGYTSKVENPETLKMIIGRLTYDTRKKWRIKADNITEEDREISFSDISSFVEKQARIVNHPVFGDISIDYSNTGKQTKRPGSEKPKGASFISRPVRSSLNRDLKHVGR